MPQTKAKILVAEDDAFLMKVYKNKLTGLGYDLHAASDGEEAVAMAKEVLPDIILLDLVMPKKNGFEVLQELKADKATQKVPVVILSNLGQDGDVEKGKELGAVDYIIKANVAINEVVAKIEQHLAEAGGGKLGSQEQEVNHASILRSSGASKDRSLSATQVEESEEPHDSAQGLRQGEESAVAGESVFCSGCGNPVADDAQFCSGCGKKLNE